jgi:hypothetical protein
MHVRDGLEPSLPTIQPADDSDDQPAVYWLAGLLTIQPTDSRLTNQPTYQPTAHWLAGLPTNTPTNDQHTYRPTVG